MDRRIKKTRRAIVEAYLKLLLEKDAKKITVSEIARCADVDRKTFYLHFESVEGLIDYAYEEKYENLRKKLEEALKIEHSLSGELVLKCFDEELEEEENLYRCITASDNADYFWSKIQRLLIDSVRKENAALDGEEAEKMLVRADFFVGGLTTAYRRFFAGESKLGIDQIGHIIAGIMNDSKVLTNTPA